MSDVLRRWRPTEGAWDRGAATHLLRRTGFGPAPGEVERALDEGLDATLQRIFATDAHDQTLYDSIGSQLARGDIETLQAWWMALILAGGAPLRERVTLFWHDHFATSHDKVDDVRLMHRQNELFRQAGLGDFRSLLQDVAKDTAMLVWLDGNENRRGQPNENFAREVMELFALGIGNYTEQDVQEAARGLTGWGTEGRRSVFRERYHDDGEKHVLGRRGPLGAEDVVAAVLEHPACSRYVARRLLAEFVAPEPDASWVEGLAHELVRQEWRIDRSLETLFASELFFSPRARRARIAGPVELVAISVRALGARVAPARAARAAERMGQALFRPPSVKGWDGMRAWINVGTWPTRHDTLHALAHGEDAQVDLRSAFGDPRSAADIPTRVRATLIPDFEDARFDAVLAEAASESNDIDEALAVVTALVLTSPEYSLV